MANEKQAPATGVAAEAGVGRRDMLKSAAAAGAAGVAAVSAPTASDAFVFRDAIFTHGVASGDPTTTNVILWTRATSSGGFDIPVEWRVSTTPDMANVVRSGEDLARVLRDHTVKVDVAGLSPGQTYYYQFRTRGSVSPVGVTRTLPVGSVSNVKFAVFSCANYERGYFNVYKEVAKRDDLTAVLFLGDYIYEYGPGEYGPTPAEAYGLVNPRVRSDTLKPQHEIVTLEDYRQRYATYRSDPHLQEMHRKNPWIAVWDDHETANDSWYGGAENHSAETEGAWVNRVAAAVQAYHEWMPIRDSASGNRLNIWRSFDFGNLVRLMMIDTRLLARDEQLEATPFIANWQAAFQGQPYPADTRADGQVRTLLGSEQETWLNGQVAGSTQTWQLFGNQVFMHYEAAPDLANSPRLSAEQRTQILALLEQLFPGQSTLIAQLGAVGLPLPDFSDWWIGYPTARDRMYALMAAARNPVVITGDTHNSWGVNLRTLGSTGYRSIGVEFATTSVSSPGYEETVPVVTPEQAAGLIMDATQILDQMVYANTHQRGWMILDITPQRARNEWYFVSTVFSETYTVTLGRVAECPAGARAMTITA